MAGKRRRTARLGAPAMRLALLWELLADEGGQHLFEGGLRARVRRRLPSEQVPKAVEPRLPRRVLLLLARPEDAPAGLIGPRASPGQPHSLSDLPCLVALKKLPPLIPHGTASPGSGR